MLALIIATCLIVPSIVVVNKTCNKSTPPPIVQYRSNLPYTNIANYRPIEGSSPQYELTKIPMVERPNEKKYRCAAAESYLEAYRERLGKKGLIVTYWYIGDGKYNVNVSVPVPPQHIYMNSSDPRGWDMIREAFNKLDKN